MEFSILYFNYFTQNDCVTATDVNEFEGLYNYKLAQFLGGNGNTEHKFCATTLMEFEAIETQLTLIANNWNSNSGTSLVDIQSNLYITKEWIKFIAQKQAIEVYKTELQNLVPIFNNIILNENSQITYFINNLLDKVRLELYQDFEIFKFNSICTHGGIIIVSFFDVLCKHGYKANEYFENISNETHIKILNDSGALKCIKVLCECYGYENINMDKIVTSTPQTNGPAIDTAPNSPALKRTKPKKVITDFKDLFKLPTPKGGSIATKANFANDCLQVLAEIIPENFNGLEYQNTNIDNNAIVALWIKVMLQQKLIIGRDVFVNFLNVYWNGFFMDKSQPSKSLVRASEQHLTDITNQINSIKNKYFK